MRLHRLIVALLGFSGLFLSGCGKDTQTTALKAELTDLRKSFAEAEEELGPLRDDHANALAREEKLHGLLKEAQLSAGRLQIQKQEMETRFQRQEERLSKILEDVETSHKKHQKEMEALRNEFEEYKRKYRISLRLRAPGTELPDLEYDGNRYTNPVVIYATPAALEIRHEDGIAILDFAYLSTQIRTRFGYHPGEAAEYAKFQQENKVENLVNHLAEEKEEATFRQKVELRILYKAWEGKLARADVQIRRKEAEIKSLQNQLRRTSSRSSGAARLRNDIERFKRDLFFLQRDRQSVALEEPYNPDAE